CAFVPPLWLRAAGCGHPASARGWGIVTSVDGPSPSRIRATTRFGSVLVRSTGDPRRRNILGVARHRTLVLLLSAVTAAALLAMVALALRQPNLDLVQVGSAVFLSIPARAVRLVVGLLR